LPEFSRRCPLLAVGDAAGTEESSRSCGKGGKCFDASRIGHTHSGSFWPPISGNESPRSKSERPTLGRSDYTTSTCRRYFLRSSVERTAVHKKVVESHGDHASYRHGRSRLPPAIRNRRDRPRISKIETRLREGTQRRNCSAPNLRVRQDFLAESTARKSCRTRNSPVVYLAIWNAILGHSKVDVSRNVQWPSHSKNSSNRLPIRA
jgi:hypothetical protein